MWPPEAFEEGAEFLESLSKCYANAHGPALKIAFAKTLILLLHPIGKARNCCHNRLKVPSSPSFGRPLKQRPIIPNGEKQLRLSTPEQER